MDVGVDEGVDVMEGNTSEENEGISSYLFWILASFLGNSIENPPIAAVTIATDINKTAKGVNPFWTFITRNYIITSGASQNYRLRL